LIIKEGPYDFIYLAKNYSKDVVSFRKSLSQSEKERLSAIEKRIGSDSLSKSYFNICIMDGQNLSFSFESASFSKDVTVSNFYNETIAFVIDLVNTMTPKKYRLWYDKEFLLKQQNACDWQRKQ
jgi:aromatic ring-opening dioxygenase LigB subunit